MNNQTEVQAVREVHDELAMGVRVMVGQFSGPLEYPRAKLCVGVIHTLSTTFIAWSGAKIDMRINPIAYQEAPDEYEVPAGIDYDVPIWQPYPTASIHDDDTGIDLVRALAELYVLMKLWHQSPVARRRHVKKDRLEGSTLGLYLYPEQGLVDVSVQGVDLLEVFSTDLADSL